MQITTEPSLNYVPYFQPIFSVEDQTVVAYESLGRGVTLNGDVYGIPVFLQAPQTEEEQDQLLRIDSLLTEKAFQYFTDTKQKGYLFLNMTPDRILHEVEHSDGINFPIVQKAKHYGINTSRIYLEITERTSKRGIDALTTAVEFLKEQGFLIALDDVGSESSNLERLGALKPDMIKVDLNLLKRSIKSREFQSILEYLKDISLGLGSDLLFEGIENEEELHRAVDSGARFLQGYFLGRPNPHFLNPIDSEGLLKPHLDSFHQMKRKQISADLVFEDSVKNILEKLTIPVKTIGKRVLIDANSIFKQSSSIQRVYITDWDGTQVSSYYERNGESSFRENNSNLHKNWSYLPFFYKHVKQAFRNSSAWQVSEPYWDKSLNQKLVVFSKILEGQLSIFIDVSIPKT
ncbi:EAL domain-containing protein [Leptospira ilyithenensis]|uniref:EAL domain-containing protein n=1 Tax=Leptospira ilyithenensis TaxID=2484901 RepID=A0A4R9LU15_9LEPT|nr:EAL domain-containing protein [Leptospira ilyithenensis]TGN13711.1 EAL domain-containing protein [Leptospira ilyithenensis]